MIVSLAYKFKVKVFC